MKNSPRGHASHILAAASNLMGFCFLVLTSLKILDKSSQTLIDEVMAVAAALFMFSSLLSFLSLRSRNSRWAGHHEAAADVLFLLGQAVLLLSLVFIAFDLLE